MVDFSRFAVVGYKDATGIGRQCHNMRRVLGVGIHLVAPSTRLPGDAVFEAAERSLLADCSPNELRTLLRGLRGIFVIERNKWHPLLFEIAREMKIVVALVPNWEWFDPSDRAYEQVDVFICQTEQTKIHLEAMRISPLVCLPPPVDLDLLPVRHIKGPATTFIHNAGIVDRNDRKGTRAVIAAWEKLNRQHPLVVRYQASDIPLPRPTIKSSVTRVRGSREVSSLYRTGDCAIQPSRLEGLGYMVLEPLLCGIPTITTNAPPMNEWRDGSLCVRCSRSMEPPIPRTRGIGSATLVDIDQSALRAAIEQVAESDLQTLSAAAREFRERFEHRKMRAKWLSALQNF